MKNTKIISDGDSIHIDCPNCDNWEEIGIDDPRHSLNSLPIVGWEEEISFHRCTECKEAFQVEWDYKNKITQL